MSKPLRAFVVACSSLCVLGGWGAVKIGEANAAELKAGVARVDLTPPLELGSPLGGYGERMNRPAEGVHDRVFAKALVLADGDKKFAVVTVDIVGFPPPLKPMLIERLAGKGWTKDKIMLLPSHSHTSIEMNAINPTNLFNIPQIGIYNPKVFEFVMERLVQVVQDAERQMAPVSIGTSSISIDGWNRNRRGGDVTDKDLTITRVDTTEGKPLAVLVNFTAHPTFMSGEDMLFSGDWPGHLQRTIESLIGEGVVAMYYNGAQGDQSPVGRSDSGDSRWERAEHYGRDLGIVAWKQWQQTSTQQDVAFDYHLHTIALPEHAWHPDFMKTGGTEYGLSDQLLKKLLPLMFPAQADSISLRMGDLLIVGIPGELAASLGLKVKSEAARIAGASHPTIGGLADLWISYMLPADEYRRGGYESSVSFYGETLGDTIVEGVLAGVKEMDR
ncbi:MAG: neutral/alkaline non-lysosomal ceramidase N-terminal domain-containing protein [Planctomycetes bacterium]|nr:neutral/alkaline non-lysosomal ceramidase N-terminal domain-containing protein [Planctomycetota bacterium]